MRRLVVTGTGRCGTRYASHVLRAAGVVCGHEQVFTFKTALRGKPPRWRELPADASWLAVPHLPVRARTLLLVRHPLGVVRSMLSLGWFADGERLLIYRVVERHMPQVLAETTRGDRCLALWLHWNRVALPHVDDVVHFEDMIADPAALLGPAGITARPSASALAEIRADPARTNSKDDKKVLAARPAWGDFRPALAREVMQTAADFGYEEEAL